MVQPTLLLTPIKSAICPSGGTFDVLVRVQAPDKPAENQSKVTAKRLALVVDRSGSMAGQPLAEALKCVMHIASRMTPADQMALVVYDNTVDTLVALTRMKSDEAIRHAVAEVQSGGVTDLFAGWEAGAKQLEGGTPESISRVILLSDGQANHGLLDIGEIETHCRAWLAKGVSTTTVGLGRGFNEDLMIAMAGAGGGQQYYGQTANDLYDNFDEEFSLLQALCLRRLEIKLIPAAGVIIETIGLVRQMADGGYQLSDLAWSSEAAMVLRLHLSPSAVGDRRDLLAVNLLASALDGTAVTAHSDMLRLPVVDPTAFEEQPTDELVQRRVQEFEFASASLALRHVAQLGDMRQVHAMLDDLEKRFGQHPWLKDKLLHLRVLAHNDVVMMSKEVSFSSEKMSRRLNVMDEQAYSVDETHSAIPAFLRKKAQEGKGRKPS
jgi:Ca-activated chloride channel family protein